MDIARRGQWLEGLGEPAGRATCRRLAWRLGAKVVKDGHSKRRMSSENVPGERERRMTRQRRVLVPEHQNIDRSFGCALASSQQGAEATKDKAQNRAHGIHKIIEYKSNHKRYA